MNSYYSPIVQRSKDDRVFVVSLREFTEIVQPCTDGHTYDKTAKHRQELLETLIELDREYRTMKYTIVIQWSEEDRSFDALQTKKPGVLTETEGFNGVFSLKNPVSDHPCVGD